METKELKIQVPEGYEIDKENSTFECIKFKKKSVTIMDIMDKFKEKCNYPVKVLATSNTHMHKILAINSLILVAKYLNEGWVPNFNNSNEPKYFMATTSGNTVYIEKVCGFNASVVYFKTNELAQQAINILGEDTIRIALSPNY